MASVNKAILLGRLGQDPELRYTQSGQPVATFNIATNEYWTDKASGERRERTEWHRIVVWGKTGEQCAKFLSKGRECYVEGRLQTREWEDKEGNKRKTTEVNAQTVQFIGGRGEGRGDSGGGNPAGGSGDGPAPGSASGSPSGGDDIPF